MAAVRDIIILAAVMFALGIGFLTSYKVVNETYDRLLGIESFNESTAAVEAVQGAKAATNRMDYVVFGVFVGMILGIMVTGWFLGGNAIFAFIYFLVVVIGVVLSTVIANTWETASQMSMFVTTLPAFPITNNILLNLPIYIAVVGLLGMIVMFAKPAVTGGGNEFI